MNKNIKTQGISKIEEQILAILDEKPGLKVREIAIYLDVDKKFINNALYGNIKIGRGSFVDVIRLGIKDYLNLVGILKDFGFMKYGITLIVALKKSING